MDTDGFVFGGGDERDRTEQKKGTPPVGGSHHQTNDSLVPARADLTNPIA